MDVRRIGSLLPPCGVQAASNFNHRLISPKSVFYRRMVEDGGCELSKDAIQVALCWMVKNKRIMSPHSSQVQKPDIETSSGTHTEKALEEKRCRFFWLLHLPVLVPSPQPC